MSKRRLSVLLLVSASSLAVSSCACSQFAPIIISYASSKAEVAMTVDQTAALFAKAASRYGEAITAASLFEKYGSALSTSGSQTTFSDLMLLSYLCFYDRLPEKKGARKFQGYPASINSMAFYRISKSSALYTALKWLCEYGLIAPGNSIIVPEASVTESEIKRQLDRFHAYIGESYKDDFFATVNHDFLYENEEVPDVGPEGKAYKSNLVPESNINAWAKEQFKTNEDAAAFYETFVDTANREDGTIGGLVTDLNTLLNAADISAFITALKNLAINRGYCPLWSDLSYESSPTIGGKESAIKVLEAETYDGTFSSRDVRKGSRGYNESVLRFTPIFQECLGVSESQAKSYATAYTDFKYDYAVGRYNYNRFESISYQPQQGVVFGDQNKGLNLYQFLKDIGVANPEYFIFSNTASTRAFFDLFDDDHLAELKGLCIWQMLEHFSLALPDKTATMAWAHNSDEVHHDAETLASDDFFSDYVIPAISGNLANVYSRTPEYKEDAEKVYTLVDNLKAKFATRASASSWLSADAKSKVNTKLDHLITFVSSSAKGDEPYAWVEPDYLSLKEGGTAYINLALKDKANLEKYGPLVGTSWTKDNRKDALTETMAEYDPLFANAFYVPWENGVVIFLGYMAAYKRPSLMTDEEFLASYGWVVGHEISHGFDSTGIAYNEKGERPYGGWLSRTDTNNFNTLASSVSSYYSKYEVMPGQQASGSVVLGEAIADITGVSLALDVGKDIEGFSLEKFFKEAASNFAAYASQAVYASSLASDEHPFGRGRINPALSALDDFYTTFDIQEGDGMYVAPGDRPKIW